MYADATEFVNEAVYGSGVLTYEWYTGCEKTVEGYVVTIDCEGEYGRKELTTSDILDAARKLLDERKYAAVGDDGSYTRLGLANLIALDYDQTDIDADVADLILQTAVLGDVVFS